MSRTCFLHAGTHKTGTKYIQSFLVRNEYALASQGLLIPTTGRTSLGAHHNIAWEFLSDPRYDPRLGTWNELIAELFSAKLPRACVSSEDFQSLYVNVEALRIFRTRLNEIDYKVKVLFFLRPQADYAESVYTELVRHGLKFDFYEFLGLFASGRFNESLTPDYSRLLKPFVGVFGLENVIVCRFRSTGRPEDILIDFVSQMLPGFDLSSGKYQTDRFRENVSVPFAKVFQLFVYNNLGQFSESLQMDAISLVKHIQPNAGGYDYLYGPFDPLNFVDVLTRFWKLGISNLKVLKIHHVFIPVVSSKALSKDLSTLLRLESGARKRRALVRTFRRASDRLRAVLKDLGQSGSRLCSDSHRPEDEMLGSAVRHNGDQLVDNLTKSSRHDFERPQNHELAGGEREREESKLHAAREIAAREREIERLKTEILRLQELLIKPPFSFGRIWFPVKHSLFVRLRSAVVGCFAGGRQSFSNFRRRKFARLITDTRLFDASFYLTQIPELQGSVVDPLVHFLEHGTEADVDPHPLFDKSYYLEQNPDVARVGVNPLLHFIKHGAQEGRDPHPLFSVSYYLEQNLDIARTGANPLVHFIAHGVYEGRNPCPLFDVSYYLEQNPEVAKAGQNPLVHFIQRGTYEGRDPHPLFDTSYYLERNPEVAIEGLNPLVHFIRYGALQGRNPHPLFDIAYYRQHSPDMEGPGFNPLLRFVSIVNPLVHFLRYGVHDRRDPHPLFDTSFYLEKNPDVVGAGLNPLVHFLKRGAYEGRDPSPLFDVLRYLEENPDVAKSGINPLVHFVTRAENDRTGTGNCLTSQIPHG